MKMAFAVLRANPEALGGMIIYGRDCPLKTALVTVLSNEFDLLTMPSNAGYTELHGGLDGTRSLAEGREIHFPGLLERAATRGLLIPSAQRLPLNINAEVCRALDNTHTSARPRIVVATDDSLEHEPGLHGSGLAQRLALHVVIPDVSSLALFSRDELLSDATGAGLFSSVNANTTISPERVVLTNRVLQEFTGLAMELGIQSMLPVMNTCRVARTLAALRSRESVEEEDAVLAVQLALAPHATQSPDAAQPPDDADDDNVEHQQADGQPPEADDIPPSQRDQSPEDDTNTQAPDNQQPAGEMRERLVAAASASLPPHLLASLAASRVRSSDAGRDKQSTVIGQTGRPIGVRKLKGSLRGERLNIIETLKAAVPMQTIRRGEHTSDKRPDNLIQLRRDDLRITRYRQSTRTTTLFIVDASGSAAMARLAEAKGAVELLLAECYVRRDKVALITFRGTGANLDLPPTRSLTRAKRTLQNLPGGGGTPLASGLQLAYKLLSTLCQEGESPVVVIMSDAKANIALDGTASRVQAANDAEHQARLLGNTGARLLFVDTATRKSIAAQNLAHCMGAHYLPLPRSNEAALPAAIAGVAS